MAAARLALVAAFILLSPSPSAGAPVLGGALPTPLPLFPADNWWNIDISSAPLDASSASFIAFINNGGTRRLHPDLGGEVEPGSVETYGIPYIVVDGNQPKVPVRFEYWDESDGVDLQTGQSLPFYPIPVEARTQPHWIEGGQPGNQDHRDSDRHMLIVDRTNNHLYELYNVYYDGTTWWGGSGAFFDMNVNGRRPEGWTSADAAGLAILPGLLRYDEVYGPNEIGHALRVTVRATNGYVYPASHRAGSTAGALPMGARLRLKASKDISGFPAAVQKIFRAMKKHGLIVADNGSDMYITGTFDTRWDNGVLNPAFSALSASDFEVVQRGYNPGSSTPRPTATPTTATPSPTSTLRPTATVTATPTANNIAQIQSPVPGSTLPGTSATFRWSAGTSVTQYKLKISSAPGGNDIYVATLQGLQATVHGLPRDGRKIWVRILSWKSGAWRFPPDVTYTAYTAPRSTPRITATPRVTATPTIAPTSSAGIAQMSSPAPGSKLAGSAATFKWTAGTNVSQYKLLIGSAPGGNDLYVLRPTTARETTAPNLPTDGRTLYVRLSSWKHNMWMSNHYSYAAAGP